MRKIAVALAAASLAFGMAANASDDEYGSGLNAPPSAEAMTLDLLVIRPLGLVATVAGAGLFVASLPIDLVIWNFKDPAKRLVVEPAKFTFTRELGDMQ